MTTINFDEPSTGNVNSDSQVAFEINQSGTGGAILAISKSSNGIVVESGEVFGQPGIGVYAVGHGPNAKGIEGRGEQGIGVQGSSLHGHGVFGLGGGEEGAGVCGQNGNGVGVLGISDLKTGVLGKSERGTVGVRGECGHVDGHGVEGINTNTQKGIGVFGKAITAGRFEGNVEVTGDISLLNADCAEDFDIVEQNVEPGTVMVLTEKGSIQSSYQEYDKKVAGIVSGARGYKTGIVLDRQQRSQDQDDDQNDENKSEHRLPIALMGKVYAKLTLDILQLKLAIY